MRFIFSLFSAHFVWIMILVVLISRAFVCGCVSTVPAAILIHYAHSRKQPSCSPGNIFLTSIVGLREARKSSTSILQQDSKLFLSAPPAAKFTSLIEDEFVHCLTYIHCVVEGVNSSGRQLGMGNAFAQTCRARIFSFNGKVSLFPLKEKVF